MPKNHLIKFRVTDAQKNEIKRFALSRGHVEMSSYVRECALAADPVKSYENNKILKQIQEDIQWMKQTLKYLNGLKS